MCGCMALILASRSPRRAELLREAGISFTVQAADVDETCLDNEPAEEYVRRLAREKAQHVAQSAPAGSLVIGADTTVCVAGEILGKPAGAADAARMLRLLSGSTHRVITGFCIVRAPQQILALQHECTTVTFRRLTPGEIEKYVAGGEPLDKAGAYAIQEVGDRFVENITGSFSNVVGLPVDSVVKAFKDIESG